MKNLKYIILIFLFCSCGFMSPSNRIKRILKRNPELNIKEKVQIFDTLEIKTTFITNPIITDSTFSLLSLSDTVVIKEKQLTITAVYDTIKEIIYLKGEVKSDTITKTIKKPIYYEVEVDKIIYRKSRDALSIIVFLSIAFITSVYFNVRKKKDVNSNNT